MERDEENKWAPRFEDQGPEFWADIDQSFAVPDEARVWLDDDLVDRRAPEGWMHVTTAQRAIELLKTGQVVELSLDHDLGDDERFGRGVDVVDYLAEQQEVHGRDLWPRDGISLHTANPAGRDQMARAIRRYAEKGGYEVTESRAGGQPKFTFSRSG